MLWRVGEPRIVGSRRISRTILRNVLYLAPVGLAVHLILPQIPGLEHSARLVAGASPLLVGAAFLAEVSSGACLPLAALIYPTLRIRKTEGGSGVR